MEFIKGYIYWIVSGIVISSLIITGAIYYRAVPDGETQFIIAPLDESDVLPYDFSKENDSWSDNYIEEFQNILPLPSNDSPSIPDPIPILLPEETPWEQGPSDQGVVSIPTPPPSQTPWGQGPSD